MITKGVGNRQFSTFAFVIAALMILMGLINTRLFIIFYLPIYFLLKKKYNDIRNTNNPFNIVDAGILIIALFEFISVFFPGHLLLNNQIKAVQGMLCVTVLWFYLRLFIFNEKQLQAIRILLSVSAGVLSILTIISYIKHKQFVSDMGSEDMISFRAYYHPLGCLSNDWCAILLSLLPMPVIAILYSKTTFQKLIHSLCFYLITVALLISFSRGVYIVLSFFVFLHCILSYILKCPYRKQVSIIMLIFILSSSTVICFDRKSFLLTCQMSKTTVQKQSIEGRITKWDESIDLFKLSPVYGVGSGNYGLAYDYFIKEKRNNITKRATNTYLQLIVEKGYVGTAIIILSLILIVYGGIKAVIRDKRKLPLLLALFALALREVVFSSFFVDRRIPMLCVIILFLTIQRSENYDE